MQAYFSSGVYLGHEVKRYSQGSKEQCDQLYQKLRQIGAEAYVDRVDQLKESKHFITEVLWGFYLYPTHLLLSTGIDWDRIGGPALTRLTQSRLRLRSRVLVFPICPDPPRMKIFFFAIVAVTSSTLLLLLLLLLLFLLLLFLLLLLLLLFIFLFSFLLTIKILKSIEFHPNPFQTAITTTPLKTLFWRRGRRRIGGRRLSLGAT